MATVKCPNCKHLFDPATSEARSGSTASTRRNPALLLEAVAAEHDRNKGLTHEQIADVVGIRQGTVSNLLNIQRRLDRSVVRLWVDACKSGEPYAPLDAMRRFAADVEDGELGKAQQMAQYRRLAEQARLKKDHTREKHRVSRRQIPG